MEHNKSIIRPARPKDAPVAAQLMYYAGPNYTLAFFGKTEDKAIGVLRRMFRLPRHTTSYTYAFIAEDEDVVVGLLSGLDGKSWRASMRASQMYGLMWFLAVPPWQIPRMIAAFDDFDKAMPPILDEEYYIINLAVLPERRRQGIGKKLVGFATGQAQTKGLKRLVLDAELENEGAQQFYQRLGFHEVKLVTDPSFCKRFNFQGSVRMVKATSEFGQGELREGI